MIKFSLVCQDGHEFEGWFQSGGAYEVQTACGQLTCPHCGSHMVDKAVMAPAVVAKRAAHEPAEAVPPTPPKVPTPEMHRLMRKLRDEVHAKAEYVGGRSAEEARRIHFDEGPERGIYGEASADEVRELAEDGVPFFPLPRLPEDLN